MCGGLLKEFIKRVISEGGKAERVTYSLVDSEVKKDLREYKIMLRQLQGRVKGAVKLLR